MKWNSFEYQGTTHDLSHLDPFEWHYTTEAGKNHPETTYKFHVTFSMHCFTRKPKDGEQIANDLWYQGPKEDRVFCFDRYELSQQLPGIIQDLGDRPCWHTHHGNYFTIEVITQGGQAVDYEVYFDVTRAARKGWLHLVVNSAYVRTAGYASTQPRKRKIRLRVIAHNTQKGKPINPGQ